MQFVIYNSNTYSPAWNQTSLCGQNILFCQKVVYFCINIMLPLNLRVVELWWLSHREPSNLSKICCISHVFDKLIQEISLILGIIIHDSLEWKLSFWFVMLATGMKLQFKNLFISASLKPIGIILGGSQDGFSWISWRSWKQTNKQK